MIWKKSLPKISIALSLAGCAADPVKTTRLDPAELLGPDEARAAQLVEGDDDAFIGGTAGESGPGDYLLYNDRARFALRGLRLGQGYVGEPGALIDLDIVRPEGQPDRDGLDELLTMAGFGRLLIAEEYLVLNDGADGGAALVWSRGTDIAIPYMEGMLEAPGTFPANGLEVTQLYKLEPGSPALMITTRVHNPGTKTLSLDLIDAGMADIATHSAFVPGAGFSGESPDETRPLMALVSRMNDQAWALFYEENDLEQGISAFGDSLDMVIAQGPRMELPPGATASCTRLVAVARDLAEIEAFRRSLRGLPTGTVRGSVLEEGTGTPIPGARVFLLDLDGDPLDVAVSAEDGSYSLAAEPGAVRLLVVGDANNEVMDLPAGPGSYGVHAQASANEPALLGFSDPAALRLSPLADGYGRSEPVELELVAGEESSVDLRLPERSCLNLRTLDGDAAPLPAFVQVFHAAGTSDPQPMDERLGEERPRGWARRAAWLRDGELELCLPAGRYDLVAQHGPRYEWGIERDLELKAGQSRDVELVLTESYRPEGWISADFHAHASPSIDGQITVEERLMSALVNDVQLHVSTDHDNAADYSPVARAMEVEGRLLSVPGSEISSNVRGHVNLWPLEPDPYAPNGGSPRWWEVQLDTDAYYAWLRDLAGPQALLQVNHGTDGLFSTSGYDPESGAPDRPDRFSDDFDSMEILNSSDVDEALLLREIWCSLDDASPAPIAVGNSDSHGALPGSGVSRTWLGLGANEVFAEDLDALVETLLDGRAIVSSGPFVSFQASDGLNSVGVGETLDSSEATLSVEVLAPSWMPIDEVRLYSSGCELVQSWMIEDGAEAPPRWFEVELEVAPEPGTCFFVEVEGWTAMDPAWPGARPYALTNPICIGG